MATFRFNPTVVVFIVFSLACMSREGTPEAAPASPGEASTQQTQIEHVTPRRDFVGKTPTVLEWTAVAGADAYALTVENEIEIVVFEREGLATNSMPWPKDVKVDPGTYYWRIVAIKGDRLVGDSGRAAFVVRE